MAEVTACPNCDRQLQIPATFYGQTVQCPDCQHMFQASAPASAVEPAPVKTAPIPQETAPIPKQEHLPKRRPVEDDEDDDFDDDYPRLRRRPYLEPHRAGLILTMGILSIFFFPLIFGSIAWIMGSADLKEMEAGRMDPSGEGQTRAGRMLGLVMVIVNFAYLVLVLVGVFIFMVVLLLSMQ